MIPFFFIVLIFSSFAFPSELEKLPVNFPKELTLQPFPSSMTEYQTQEYYRVFAYNIFPKWMHDDASVRNWYKIIYKPNDIRRVIIRNEEVRSATECYRALLFVNVETYQKLSAIYSFYLKRLTDASCVKTDYYISCFCKAYEIAPPTHIICNKPVCTGLRDILHDCFLYNRKMADVHVHNLLLDVCAYAQVHMQKYKNERVCYGNMKLTTDMLLQAETNGVSVFFRKIVKFLPVGFSYVVNETVILPDDILLNLSAAMPFLIKDEEKKKAVLNPFEKEGFQMEYESISLEHQDLSLGKWTIRKEKFFKIIKNRTQNNMN